MIPQVHVFVARSAAGRPVRKTAGLAPAGMNGTRSTREECVPLACTNGLKLSASRVDYGRRIRTGMPEINGSFLASLSLQIEFAIHELPLNVIPAARPFVSTKDI